MANLIQTSNKAKVLDIPVVDLYGDDLIQGMQQLGEYASTHSQLIFAGQVTPMLKQILPHLQSVTEQICIIDDAMLMSSQEQHIQWIENISAQGLHHMNSYSLTRLWNLSAPSEYILSSKGIMLAVAEQLDMDALDIDPMSTSDSMDWIRLQWSIWLVYGVPMVQISVMKMYYSIHLCMRW